MKDFRPFPKQALERSIPERFREIATANRDEVAVRFEGAQWTYGQLDRVTDRIAANLMDSSAKEAESVVLFCDQGWEVVAAILGTLKAGKHYVPMDPFWPKHQIEEILRSLPPFLPVSDEHHFNTARNLCGHDNRVRSIRDLMTRESTPWKAWEIEPNRLTYLHFTSGSTGKPKGVKDCHRNVLHNVLRYTNRLEITPADKISLVHSPNYSACVSSLFIALLNGATLCPLNLRKQGFAALPQWVIQERITVFHAIPEVFRKAVDARGRDSQLRIIRLEGDQAKQEDLDLYKRLCPDECILVNGYGMTESGLVSQYFANKATEHHSPTLPVGKPVEDIRIEITDDRGLTLTRGNWGNVVIKSKYLSLGYWEDSEKTIRSGLNAGKYLTGDTGRFLADGNLELADRIPQQQQAAPAVDALPAQTKTESLLTDLWGIVLDCGGIHVNDHFFQLGGDSIKAMQLVAQLNQHFQKDIPLRLVFDHPVLKDQAKHLEEAGYW